MDPISPLKLALFGLMMGACFSIAFRVYVLIPVICLLILAGGVGSIRFHDWDHLLDGALLSGTAEIGYLIGMFIWALFWKRYFNKDHLRLS